MNIKDVTKNYAAGAGVAKCRMSTQRILFMAIVSGMYLTFAATASTIGSCMVENGSVSKILAGLLFAPGLGFVIANGAELFTGNNLIIISVLDRKAKMMEMLRNWVLVYIGNYIGSLLISAIAVYGNVFSLFGGGAATAALNTAVAKCSIAFMPGLCKGILCNFLVCIAVMMALCAESLAGKFFIAALPVILFVISGFEHSIANMGYVSIAMFLKTTGQTVDGAEVINLANFAIKNLIPVTIGNILGGCLAGFTYWYPNIKQPN